MADKPKEGTSTLDKPQTEVPGPDKPQGDASAPGKPQENACASDKPQGDATAPGKTQEDASASDKHQEETSAVDKPRGDASDIPAVDERAKENAGSQGDPVQIETANVMKVENEDLFIISEDEDAECQSNGVEKEQNDSKEDKTTSEAKGNIDSEPRELDPSRQHPYKHLLDDYKPTPYDTSKMKLFNVLPMNKVTCITVETKPLLEELSEQLMLQKEIGVAIKYNTYNYSPRLCYLLISTRRNNYMIDCIKLSESLHLLSDVFTNPNIVKVMCAMQFLRNLQVEHNLWFVNIFDLQVAFRKLAWKKTLFQYLADYYNVKKTPDVNLTNWQARPLPETYRINAIMTIHYLIHIYYTLKNMLIDSKQIKPFLTQCNRLCGVVFPTSRTFDEMFPDMQYREANEAAIICALEEWRQQMGKKKQRNVVLILTNKQMEKLATQKPTKVVDILTIASTVHVENNVNEIQKIISTLKEVIGPVNLKPGAVLPSRKTKADNTKKRADGDKKDGKQAFKKKRSFKSKADRLAFLAKPNNPSGGGFVHKFPPAARGRGTFKRRGGFFNNVLQGPSPKRPHISPWDNQGGIMSHSLPPTPHHPVERPASPPSYLILSNKGEAFQVAGSAVLSSYLGNRAQTQSFHSNGSGNRSVWQHNEAPVWEMSNKSSMSNRPLNTIDQLLNLHTSLNSASSRNDLDDSRTRFNRGQTRDSWLNQRRGSWKNQSNRPSTATSSRNYEPIFSGNNRQPNHNVTSYPRYNATAYSRQGF